MGDPLPTPDVPEPQERARGDRLMSIVWLLLAVLVLYPLSTGPAAWLAIKQPSTAQALKTFYAPIGVACSHSHALEQALVWYLTVVWRVPLPVYK